MSGNDGAEMLISAFKSKKSISCPELAEDYLTPRVKIIKFSIKLCKYHIEQL